MLPARGLTGGEPNPDGTPDLTSPGGAEFLPDEVGAERRQRSTSLAVPGRSVGAICRQCLSAATQASERPLRSSERQRLSHGSVREVSHTMRLVTPSIPTPPEAGNGTRHAAMVAAQP